MCAYYWQYYGCITESKIISSLLGSISELEFDLSLEESFGDRQVVGQTEGVTWLGKLVQGAEIV